MTIKIGINGFGRIGRMVFRAAVQNFADIQIVGINDLLEPDYLAYMLQYDSVHGRFKGEVSVDGNTLIVNGQRIRLTAVKNPAELAWGEVGADIVVEATGLFLTQESAEPHLLAGARKVIMSAPSNVLLAGGRDFLSAEPVRCTVGHISFRCRTLSGPALWDRCIYSDDVPGLPVVCFPGTNKQ